MFEPQGSIDPVASRQGRPTAIARAMIVVGMVLIVLASLLALFVL